MESGRETVDHVRLCAVKKVSHAGEGQQYKGCLGAVLSR